ncbi:MAG: hypothetical protein NTX29_07775, partial [Actinobacteria bacterium]|nr:hypothetical protein [Actinomycetota bacterium]
MLYLVKRQPSGTATYVTSPVMPAATGSVDDATTTTSAEASTAAATTQPTLPAAYAYGGSGQYPGYVAPQPTPIPPRPPRPRSYLGLITLSVVVLVTGLLATLEATGVTDLAPVVIPAVALAILGAGILVGAWVGRARWLLWFAIPTLLVTITASFVPSEFG